MTTNKEDLESPKSNEESEDTDNDQCVPDKEKLLDTSSDESSMEIETKEEPDAQRSSDDFEVIPTPSPTQNDKLELELEEEKPVEAVVEDNEENEAVEAEVTEDEATIRQRRVPPSITD